MPRCLWFSKWFDNSNHQCQEFGISYGNGQFHNHLGIGWSYWPLTHWDRVTHICVGKKIIIGSDKGLPPDWRQAIIWANAGLLSMEPLRTYFIENLIKIQPFSLKKMHVKMLSAKWHPSCLGLNVLTRRPLEDVVVMLCVISEHMLWAFLVKLHRWKQQNIFNVKSKLVQVMTWCCQGPSHYLSRCWPSFMPSYDITMS